MYIVMVQNVGSSQIYFYSVWATEIIFQRRDFVNFCLPRQLVPIIKLIVVWLAPEEHVSTEVVVYNMLYWIELSCEKLGIKY